MLNTKFFVQWVCELLSICQNCGWKMAARASTQAYEIGVFLDFCSMGMGVKR